MQLVVTVEHVNDPVEDVTVYDVMALPPLLVGAVQETVIDESPNAVVAEVGAPGTAAGMMPAVEPDGLPVPTLFVATTVKVYEDPFVSPDTVQVVISEVHVNEPGEDVTR